MQYIYIDRNRVVQEFLPMFDPVFPGVPIEQRYSADFLSHVLEVPDETVVEQSWVYDPQTNTFSEPIVPEIEPEPPRPELPEPEPSPDPVRPTETQLLGQQITDEQLERIAMGQQYTELELAILGGTSHV